MAVALINMLRLLVYVPKRCIDPMTLVQLQVGFKSFGPTPQELSFATRYELRTTITMAHMALGWETNFGLLLWPLLALSLRMLNCKKHAFDKFHSTSQVC